MSQPSSRARRLSEHTWDNTGSEFVLTLANTPTSPWAQSMLEQASHCSPLRHLGAEPSLLPEMMVPFTSC